MQSSAKPGEAEGRGPQRLVRTVYAARANAFAYCFVALGLLSWDRGAGPAGWIALTLTFLAYPHAAYRIARAARDPRRAEHLNLLLDAALFGAWAAQFGFPPPLSYALLSGATLNNLVNRGLPGLLPSIALFGLGAAVWGGVRGFEYQPQISPLITALSFFGALGYACLVGLIVQRQTRRIVLAREKLRMSEEAYRLITENAGDLIAMIDADGRWRYVSPSHARILPPADLALGTDAFRCAHADDAAHARAALRRMIATGEAGEFSMRIVCIDGAERVFDCSGHAVRDAAGKYSRVVLVSRDVTELHQQREQLKVAALAFENINEAIMITAADGRIVTVNKAFSRITGFAAEEVVGRSESDYRLAMQPAEYYAELYAEVARSGHWTGSTWSRRKDGALYRELRSLSAVRDEANRIAYYVAIFFEIDPSKHVAPAVP
jgi:PAS domain S-box-containing protein